MSNGFSRFSNFKFNFRRVWVDVLALISLLLVGFLAPAAWFPIAAKIGFVSLLFSKLIFVSCGILHAHISRKLIWNYIDFNTTTDVMSKVMIIAWYVIIIFAWCRGG